MSSKSIAIGMTALTVNTTGNRNTAIGRNALFSFNNDPVIMFDELLKMEKVFVKHSILFLEKLYKDGWDLCVAHKDLVNKSCFDEYKAPNMWCIGLHVLEKKTSQHDIETIRLSGNQIYIVGWKKEDKSFGKHICPLCGSNGDDLVFSFYCSNEGCQNYRC